MPNFSIKKNDIMYIFAIFFILAIIYYIFYKEGFENNYIKSKLYPYKLSDIRLLTKKNITRSCGTIDYKTIIIEDLNIDISNKNDPVVKEKIRNLKILYNLLFSSIFNLITCEFTSAIANCKSFIKKLLIHISKKNAYSNTTNIDTISRLLYMSFIPLLFQSYLLINDILNKKENEIILKYLKKMNNIINKNKSEFLKIQSHDLRDSTYSFVYGIISNNKKMYKDGFDNLNKLLTNPNLGISGYSNKTPINNIIAFLNDGFLYDLLDQHNRIYNTNMMINEFLNNK